MKKYNGLTKYQKAQNFRANAKYLTKDFIVPLYTGSEVEIPKQSKTELLEEMIIEYQKKTTNEIEKKE